MEGPLILDVRGGALGDEICAEPIVRYTLKMGYDVRVISNYPQVFHHLEIPVGYDVLSQGEVAGNYIYGSPYVAHGGGVNTHPFSHFAQPLLTHPVDFLSLFMLRKSIPDTDKRPKLGVLGQAKEKIDSLTPNKFIAVHLGATEKARSWPASYAQQLVDSLECLGHAVVVFGRKTPLTPNISCKINLVDILDIPMLFALVAKACLTITNDSAPVHVAGAFDNYLIVTPTIRHPDRLLHVRHGSRYYKTYALFKKLMFDDTHFPLGLDLVSMIRAGFSWADVENRPEEFLPDVDQILETVNSIGL